MKLLSISMRNLRIRLVSTVLTTLAIAVATGLYAAIMLMAQQTRDRYEGSIGGYQAVLGPKDCSQLELLLNTIFHVGDAPGQIPMSVCDDLRAGKVSRRGAAGTQYIIEFHPTHFLKRFDRFQYGYTVATS